MVTPEVQAEQTVEILVEQAKADGENTEAGEEQTKPVRKRDNKPPPKTEKPDLEEYQASRKVFDDEVAALKIQLDNIVISIDKKKQEQQEAQAERNRLRQVASAAQASRSQLLDQQDLYRDQIEQIEKTRQSQRQYLDSLKKGLKFTSLADLDNATTKIINKLSSGTLSNDVQNKLARSLQELRSQREGVIKYNEQLKTVQSAGTTAVKGMSEEQIQSIKAAKVTVDNARKAANDQSKKDQALSKEVDQLFKQKRALTIQKKAAGDSAYNLQREFQRQERAYTRWTEYEGYLQRQKAREERAARKAAKDAEWAEYRAGKENAKKEEARAKRMENPKKKQIATVEELETYITNLMPKQATKQSVDEVDKKKSLVEDRNSQFKGEKFKAFKKDEEEENPYVLGAASIKKKKGSRKKRRNKKQDQDKQQINHIHDIFGKFMEVEVTTPITFGQLAETLEALGKKKAEYLAWTPPPEEPEVAAEPEVDPETLAVEKKEREAGRRKSIQLMDEEQKARIEELAAAAKESEEVEQNDREEARRASITLMNQEQLRRVAELAEEAAVANDEEVRVAKMNKETAVKLAEEERQRRLSETMSEEEVMTLEKQERAENVRRASAQIDAEQARRIAEDAAKALTETPSSSSSSSSGLDTISKQIASAEAARTISKQIASAEAARTAAGGFN